MMAVVPLIPLRRVDDLIERLEAVSRDANIRGFETLAYLVEMALLEARIQEQQLGERPAALNDGPQRPAN